VNRKKERIEEKRLQKKGVLLHDINLAKQAKIMGPLATETNAENEFQKEVINLHTKATRYND